MKILDAYKILKKDITLSIESEHINNKGAVGHQVEKLLGLKLNSNLRDFDDGELKTFHYNNKNQVKEDFRITTIWDLDKIEKKLSNVLVVGFDSSNNFTYVEILRPLENTFILKKLREEVAFILEKGPMNCSQKDTDVFISKTQGRGGDAPKTRSLYISRPWAHALLHRVYPPGARKGKHLVQEFELSLKNWKNCE